MEACHIYLQNKDTDMPEVAESDATTFVSPPPQDSTEAYIPEQYESAAPQDAPGNRVSVDSAASETRTVKAPLRELFSDENVEGPHRGSQYSGQDIDTEIVLINMDRKELREMTSRELEQQAKKFKIDIEAAQAGLQTLTPPMKDYMDDQKGDGDGDGGNKNKNKKGAITGVFIPTCENMWGVLIFLRFNYIIGNAGIGQALLAVSLSFLAALFTTVSLSACVSSGGVVSRGGPYHMISRATGPATGASVGLLYWMGITLLAVLETLGAVETIFLYDSSMKEFTWAIQAWASGLLVLMTAIVFGGINFVTKMGIGFFVIVFITIVSFYVGLFTVDKTLLVAKYSNLPEDIHIKLDSDNMSRNLDPHYPADVDFGDMLAVFFPCFTGILSGADRADVLRNPAKDIMMGTFGAICFSYLMYVSFMLLWGAVAPYEYLRGDYVSDLGKRTPTASFGSRRHLSSGGNDAAYVLADVPWNPFASWIYIGIIISSCSQALQCLVVAPKLLHSIAQDDVIPKLRFLGKLSKRNEPARALLVTYIIAGALVLLGSLDIVAPILSMCFLTAYIYINFSCLLLTYLKAPSWRPIGIGRKRYRIAYIVTSILGIIVCMAVMFIVDYVSAIIAIAVGILLHIYVDWCREKLDWGSGVHGVKFHLALSSLLSLEHHQQFQINWRPQVLILYQVNITNELRGIKHHEILKFYSQLSKCRGVCIAAAVLEGQIRDPHDLHKARSEKLIIQNIMKEEKIPGFAEVVVAPSWTEGANYCIQLSGLGGLTPNTVLMAWPALKWRKKAFWKELGPQAEDFVGLMSTAQAEEKAVLVVKGLSTFPEEPTDGTIDVWWMIHDGGLLILLSWLLRQHRLWRSCRLRIFTIMEDVSEHEAKSAALKLTETLRRRRLFNVEVEVILSDDSMIEPYTYDWTLRVEKRKQLLHELHPHLEEEKKLPVEIDDLFRSSSADLTHSFKAKKISRNDSEVHVQDERHEPAESSRRLPHIYQREPSTGDKKSKKFADKNPSTNTINIISMSSSASSEFGTCPASTVAALPQSHADRHTWLQPNVAGASARHGQVPSPHGPSHSTMPQMFRGTPPYIAPDGQGEVDTGHTNDVLSERAPTSAGTGSNLVPQMGEMYVEREAEPDAKPSDATGCPQSFSTPTAPDVQVFRGLVPGNVALGNMGIDQTVPASYGGNELASERLNGIIKSKSKDSQLILMNLPNIWSTSQEGSLRYMAYCDTLVMGLNRVVFVHSAGHEVFDIS
eukprot:GEMP01001357.1.p1 GENE.GEMP01001357.1~~GEMP01001357.1.p1  ORF type:complete len:1249 (+),score=221.98 GEMP01001357.1:134-3880(+)